MVSEIRTLICDLGLPIDNKRIECLLRNSEGKFHRRPRNAKIKLPQSAYAVQQAVKTIKDIDSMMKQYGFRPLPFHLYVTNIDSRYELDRKQTKALNELSKT